MSERQDSVQEALEQIDLSISGMTCSSCVATVERSLNKVPGARATVNLATETAHILVPEGTGSKTLIEAVSKAGYSAKLRSDEMESFSHSRRLGFRVLLSALLTIPVVVFSMWHELHYRIDEFILQQLENFNLPAPLYSPTGWLVIGLTAPVVLIIAWPIHRAALRNLAHPTMDNLISLGSLSAFGWSIYANSTGAGDIYAEVAASVVTFIVLGRYFESRAKKRAGSTLAHLLSLNPKEVTILRGNEEVRAPIQNLQIGELCVVRPGDRIPTDGVIVEGVSSIDNSLLTGESLPIDVAPGAEVIAGAINKNGRLVIQARRVGNDTELARITKMVLTAQGEKAPIQKLADRISSVFVPIVMLLSLATLATWLALGNPLQDSIRAAVALLVIACPCALGLATPVALLVATGKGASQGIVLRKTASLEIASKITTVVFDKTGTLTDGKLAVVRTTSLAGADAKEALELAAAVERGSKHPIAIALSGYGNLTAENIQELAGVGLVGDVAGKRVSVGKYSEVENQAELNAALAAAGPNTLVVVTWDGKARGLIELSDQIRPGATETVRELNKQELSVALLSGDNPRRVSEIADAIGIKEVLGGVSPEEKLQYLTSSGSKMAMVGDGINDVAALSAAEIGIAMGSGSQAAQAASDITILDDDPRKVPFALSLGKRTYRNILQNLGWAFGYNLLLIPVAALGLLNPMLAGLAMALSSVSVVLNSLRLKWQD